MSCYKHVATLLLVAIAAFAASSALFADDQPQIQLPPGWTAEDMQACIVAGTPGKMHELLGKDVGTWKGKCTMWMAPGAPPMTSDCAVTITPAMDGRFVKSEIAGEMPGMGPYTSVGYSGFDNVTQKFVGTWIDNHNTSIMNGTGELSPDGKVLTWNFTCSCPLTKQPMALREVDTVTEPNTKTLDTYTTDPKSGKEYKMCSIELTKK